MIRRQSDIDVQKADQEHVGDIGASEQRKKLIFRQLFSFGFADMSRKYFSIY